MTKLPFTTVITVIDVDRLPRHDLHVKLVGLSFPAREEFDHFSEKQTVVPLALLGALNGESHIPDFRRPEHCFGT